MEAQRRDRYLLEQTLMTVRTGIELGWLEKGERDREHCVHMPHAAQAIPMVNEVNLICQELVPPQPLRFVLRVQAKRGLDRFSNVFTQETEARGAWRRRGRAGLVALIERARRAQVRVDVRSSTTGELLAAWSWDRFQERAFFIKEIYANVRAHPAPLPICTSFSLSLSLSRARVRSSWSTPSWR